jgi:type III secretory pathway lipoprotein EscJ
MVREINIVTVEGYDLAEAAELRHQRTFPQKPLKRIPSLFHVKGFFLSFEIIQIGNF